MARTQIGRTQGPVQIIPRAAPIHSPVRQQQARPSNLENVAKSLAGFGTNIAQLAASYEEDRISEANKQAQDKLAGMTLEEAREMVKSGEMGELDNPYFQKAFRKQFGLAYAANRKREIIREYETNFDKTNGNLEEFLIQKVQQDQQEFAGDADIYDGIREGMGRFLDTVRNTHAEFQTGQAKQKVANNFHTLARDTVLRAISNGQDASAAVRSLYAGHKDFLGMSHKEMDETVLMVAEELANEGELPAVEALLGTEVTGRDGTNVGSFVSRRTTGQKAQRILRMAEAQNRDNRRRQMLGSYVHLAERADTGSLSETDEAVLHDLVDQELMPISTAQALITRSRRVGADRAVEADIANRKSQYLQLAMSTVINGQSHLLPDFQYADPRDPSRTHSISRDKAIAMATVDFLEGLEAQGAEPAAMGSALAATGTGVNYPKWETVMTNGATAIAEGLREKDPKTGEFTLPPAAEAGFNTWKSLAGTPVLRRRHVKDATAASIYFDAEVLESVGQMTPQQALIKAAEINSEDFRRKGISTGITKGVLEDGLKGISGGSWWPFADTEGSNRGYVSQEVEAHARVLRAAGLGEQQAVDAAVASFENTHSLVNGVWVNTANTYVPDDISDISAGIIEDYAALHDEDPDDLTLIPAGNDPNFWVVARKGTLLPHEEWNNRDAMTIGDLQSDAAARRQEAEAEAKGEVMEAIEAGQTEREQLDSARAQHERWKHIPFNHQRNHLRHTPDSEEYRELQKKHGKELYPDGGLLN